MFVDGGKLKMKEKEFLVGFKKVDGFIGNLRKCRNIGSEIIIEIEIERIYVEIEVMGGMRKFKEERNVERWEEEEKRFVMIGCIEIDKWVGIYKKLIEEWLGMWDKGMEFKCERKGIVIEIFWEEEKCKVREGVKKMLDDREWEEILKRIIIEILRSDGWVVEIEMGKMGKMKGGCGIMKLGSDEIEGEEEILIGELNESFVRFEMNIEEDGEVIGFEESGKGGEGGGRISKVIRIEDLIVERIMGVMEGKGKGIDEIEMIEWEEWIIERKSDIGIENEV